MIRWLVHTWACGQHQAHGRARAVATGLCEVRITRTWRRSLIKPLTCAGIVCLAPPAGVPEHRTQLLSRENVRGWLSSSAWVFPRCKLVVGLDVRLACATGCLGRIGQAVAATSSS